MFSPAGDGVEIKLNEEYRQTEVESSCKKDVEPVHDLNQDLEGESTLSQPASSGVKPRMLEVRLSQLGEMTSLG